MANRADDPTPERASMRIDIRDVYNQIISLETAVRARIEDHERRLITVESAVEHRTQFDTGQFQSHNIEIADHEDRLRELEKLSAKMMAAAAVGGLFGGGAVTLVGQLIGAG